MPSQRVVVLVCDLCNREPAIHQRITVNHQTVEIDLCDVHVQPLEELLERFVLASTRAPGYSTSPYRCTICDRVLSRRVHAAGHVMRVHGYTDEQSYAYIRPAGERVVQVLDGPSHRPHRCKVCKKPYVNSSTARRHVREQHPDRITARRTAATLVQLIEESA